VSQCAVDLFTACARAGTAPLLVVLDDTQTIEAFRAISGGGSVLELRALALFAALATAGEEHFEMVASRGFLDHAIMLWRGGDPLVRLNAVEIFATLARQPAGVSWLDAAGLLAELCAALDTPVGEDMLLDLLRPTLVGCLATLLEMGGRTVTDALLVEHRLVQRLWPILMTHAAEQLHAALAALRVAVATPSGMTAVLALNGTDTAAAGALTMLVRAHDERTRVGALALTAQLVSTCADATRSIAHQATHVDGTVAAMSESEAAVQTVVRACSPSSSTSATDAISGMARSLSEDLRAVALQLLSALAQTRWGAMELCASEGAIELLLTSESVHTVPAEELRLKHAVAVALAQWPFVAASLGASAAEFNAYVTAGPFTSQRSRQAVPAAPLTL
jgi:hypothetical protein